MLESRYFQPFVANNGVTDHNHRVCLFMLDCVQCRETALQVVVGISHATHVRVGKGWLLTPQNSDIVLSYPVTRKVNASVE